MKFQCDEQKIESNEKHGVDHKVQHQFFASGFIKAPLMENIGEERALARRLSSPIRINQIFTAPTGRMRSTMQRPSPKAESMTLRKSSTALVGTNA